MLQIIYCFYNLDADRTRRCFWCLCFDLREIHIDRAKLFNHAESLWCRDKQNIISLVYYSTVSSLWIKRESKLCYFQKICANKNSSKTSQLLVLARTGASVSPLRTSWMSKRSCLLLLCQIMINTRRNLAEFYKVSFAKSLASSQSSWPCFCNHLKKWPLPTQ